MRQRGRRRGGVHLLSWCVFPGRVLGIAKLSLYDENEKDFCLHCEEIVLVSVYYNL